MLGALMVVLRLSLTVRKASISGIVGVATRPSTGRCSRSDHRDIRLLCFGVLEERTERLSNRLIRIGHEVAVGVNCRLNVRVPEAFLHQVEVAAADRQRQARARMP